MRHLLAALLAPFVLLCSITAFAAQVAPEPPPPALGHPLVDQLFAYIGALLTFLTTLATILPKTWKITQVCARFATDIRGILTPDPSDDPEWAKNIRRGSSSLLILLAVLWVQSCALFRDAAVPAVVECAPDREYFIEGLASILSGQDAFDVLDRIKSEKGAELVLCAVRRFLDRVAVSPDTADARTRAQAYLDRP